MKSKRHFRKDFLVPLLRKEKKTHTNAIGSTTSIIRRGSFSLRGITPIVYSYTHPRPRGRPIAQRAVIHGRSEKKNLSLFLCAHARCTSHSHARLSIRIVCTCVYVRVQMVARASAIDYTRGERKRGSVALSCLAGSLVREPANDRLSFSLVPPLRERERGLMPRLRCVGALSLCVRERERER